MKRDFDLIRRILKEIEDMPPGEVKTIIEFPGEYDLATINEHVKLLMENRLIKGLYEEVFADLDTFMISGLTWEGHDFLDAAKDDSIWNKAKETVLKPTASITFGLLLDWLKQEAKMKLGLP